MPKIQVLDTHTANRIAAGEVVERPASAAKELIENAVDAGSTAITVEIRDGGIELLRVTDNGEGLPPGEMRIAFERHATSKIRSGDPLDAIGTLGFRGEALASIAAVSRVEMLSRRRGQDIGMRIEVEGGSVLTLNDAGCPEGTTVVVRDLFFNTPARRKFLKRPATEGGYVGDAALTQALAHPEISFRFLNNSRAAFHTPGDGDLRRTLAALFGREIDRQLLNVEGNFGPYTLYGAIGLQDAARANRQHEFFFVNGRYVRSPLLAAALEEAVKGHILIGRYPMAALYIDCPAHLVDVNVHPNKLEVRFGDEMAVRAGVLEAVRAALSPRAMGEAQVPLLPPEKKGLEPGQRPKGRVEGMTDVSQVLRQPEMRPAAFRAAESDLPPLPPMPTLRDAPPPRPSPGSQPAQLTPPPEESVPVEAAPVEITPPERTEEVVMDLPAPPPRIIGALFQTYVLAQQGEDFLIVDQHAAHERLLYDRYTEQLNSGQAQAQGLLLPMQVTATPAEAELLREHMELLRSMGFAIEEFGPSAFRVDAVPHLLGEPQLKEFFDELLSSLHRIGSAKAMEQKRDAIATMACHRAVKGGDPLTAAELAALLEQALDGDTPLTCPHGRPILLRMSRAELERRFRRIQP